MENTNSENKSMPNHEAGSTKRYRFEFHFQEGFTGQIFEIVASGRICTTVMARTRLQIGLAHIEAIDLKDGQEVLIREKSTHTETSIHVQHDKPFVVLKWVNGKLEAAMTGQSPGYL